MTNSIKKAFGLVLALQCASAQACEVSLSVNVGQNVIKGAQEAGKALCKNATNTLKNMQIPYIWQYQDGTLHTTHMHPLLITGMGIGALISTAFLYNAWKDYQSSKNDYWDCGHPKSPEDAAFNQYMKTLAAFYFTVGTLCATGVVAALYWAPKVVTATPATSI